jgi:type II secretory pathway pseudopilin PulG
VRLRRNFNRARRGDTIIEVIFAITIFCLVSIICLSLMNSGINTTESSLEQTTARAEMDAQAAALRFLHNGYVAEYEYIDLGHYINVWNKITAQAIESNDLLNTQEVSRCDAMYADAQFTANKPFVINTRMLSSSADLDTEDVENALVTPAEAPFVATPLSPRVVFTGTSNSDAELKETGVYRTVGSVEGIWITAVKGDVKQDTGIPKYYDFYIRTCWVAPGREYPTKLGTLVRLYNPQNEREGHI